MTYPGSGAKAETRFFDLPAFKMRSGDLLPRVRLAYELYGEINKSGDNLILLFHALTGSQHAAGFTSSVEERPSCGLSSAVRAEGYFRSMACSLSRV